MCICTLSSSALAPEFCHFCLDFYTISLSLNFCYNVHLWMNYGYALFYNFWKPLSRVFGRVFTIALRGWFAPNIFPVSLMLSIKLSHIYLAINRAECEKWNNSNTSKINHTQALNEQPNQTILRKIAPHSLKTKLGRVTTIAYFGFITASQKSNITTVKKGMTK